MGFSERKFRGGSAVTWAFALLHQKTFQDSAKSVPNPSEPEPLTSTFVIRACPITNLTRLSYTLVLNYWPCEGRVYVFRITAVNSVGVGPPAEASNAS